MINNPNLEKMKHIKEGQKVEVATPDGIVEGIITEIKTKEYFVKFFFESSNVLSIESGFSIKTGKPYGWYKDEGPAKDCKIVQSKKQLNKNL